MIQMDVFVSLILLNAYLIIGTYICLEDSRRSLDAGAGPGQHPRNSSRWRSATVYNPSLLVQTANNK